MSLVVGLGNPGARYRDTRHNVGWRVVERLVDRWSATPHARTESYRTWSARPEGRPVVLMMPLTFMNLSGEALEAWKASQPLEPDELLVVADDVYLPVGVLRLRGSGSNGGHRGLESIERTLGTSGYPRLRLGVGAVDAAGLRDHVLGEPDDDEREMLEQSIERAAEAVECWLAEGLLVTMNRFNRRVDKEVSES